MRFDLRIVDGFGEASRAPEAAETALGEVIALALRLLLLLLLALDGQQTIRQRDRNVLLLDAGQLGLDGDRVGALAHVELGRHHGAAALAAEQTGEGPIAL